MKTAKVFFYSFILSLMVGLAMLGGVNIILANSSKETDTPKTGVPMREASVEDSKTILLCIDSYQPFFFIFKFSAIENRVGIAAISPSFEINDEKLEDKFKKAGAMQCLLDIENLYGINIDYYIQCSWQQLGKTLSGMRDIKIDSLGENLPVSIKNYLFKGTDTLDVKSLINAAEKASAFLDNDVGLAFMAYSRHWLLENNTDLLHGCASPVIKEDYSEIVTNINTERLNRMERILHFLASAHVEYKSVVITQGDSLSHEKIDSIIQ